MARKVRPLITSTEVGNLDPEQIRTVVRAVHVLPSEQGWSVRKSGRDRVNQAFATYAEAVQFAEELSSAQNVALIFHVQTDGITVRKLSIRSRTGKKKFGRRYSVHSRTDRTPGRRR
jgi:hypothetical protein